MAGGISATTGYLMIFVLIKTYFQMEALFNLPFLFFFYAIIGGFGTIYLYFALPETENKTLEEIEKVFRKKKNSSVIEDEAFVNNKIQKS